MDKIAMTTLNLNNVTENTGLFLSGGIESSYILYKMLQQYSNTRFKVIIVGYDVYNYQEIEAAKRVLEMCKELAGNDNVEVVERRLVRSDTNSKRTDFYNIGMELGLENVVSGDTGTDQSRDPECAPINNELVMSPLADYQKTDVAQFYNDEGLMDTLFPLTVSCTSRGRANFTDHCGTCIWCQERLEAFGTL